MFCVPSISPNKGVKWGNYILLVVLKTKVRLENWDNVFMRQYHFSSWHRLFDQATVRIPSRVAKNMLVNRFVLLIFLCKYDSQCPYYEQYLFTTVEKPFYGYWLFSKLVGTAPYIWMILKELCLFLQLKWGMLLTRKQKRQNQVRLRLRQDLTQASLNSEYLIGFMHPRSYEHMKTF